MEIYDKKDDSRSALQFSERRLEIENHYIGNRRPDSIVGCLVRDKGMPVDELVEGLNKFVQDAELYL
ncbi:hypothetical protein MBAV_002765 [Candidatus Magnetobacterium bavaricum]|uniref:Uncharacterized protein n=1 Tax=Candidatus Magnetobacterium bavaricum TaxID=29290 RepID=A0A0F3GSR7_9BACT|nr:hypothetical protein MBAV_002765 [Candidatus Magnetobacterium bavaricum]